MSTTSFDSVWSFGTTKVIIPVGATLAIFCQPQAGQIGWNLNWVGGSFELLSAALGSSNLNLFMSTTQPLTTLATISGNGYPILGGSPPQLINGPASFYLSSLGATGICSILMLKGQGQ